MPRELTRDFRPEDLDEILHLWQLTATADPVYGLSEVIASCQQDDAVVAVDGDQIIGAAIGRAAHKQGWIVFLGVRPEFRERGVGTRLLAALERRLAARGIGIISALIPERQNTLDDFAGHGYEVKHHLRYAERRIPVQGRDVSLLRSLGGRLLPRGLWDAVGGMTREKELLERRLVMPLAMPDLAAEYGCAPPHAVVLFGPPGTGKTTFAKAVASRLEWPFIEVFPSRLGGNQAGVASGLRETFSQIAELDRAVVFIDEVEEIAAHRRGDPPSPTQGVTNELLKIIPEFRDQEGRLLICATNFIRALDSALLRHGRFDYIIPIGLPDALARKAIWSSYIPEGARELVDVEKLIDSSEGLTPADIEYASRKAAQVALERAIDSPDDAVPGPSTADYLDALRSIRPTVPPETIDEFLEDIERLGRL
ncbi:GNAT family N-acetyltransferase [Gordonia sp. PP30]|uniref:ATP-binding protein n=1 Tax=Gordonia sp. PP30 TaxID=2935861 RepID=UPI001FFE6327|nr:GNAT family N-acetyltransferase [Gordonia sp. PP30]UQE76481.1 GNAT family N-acetyltransferase [Gordonia sp. PP30]